MIVLHEDKLKEMHEKIYVWQMFIEALSSTDLNISDDKLDTIRKIINEAKMDKVTE